MARDARSSPAGSVTALDSQLAFAARPRLLPEARSEVFAAGERAVYRATGSDEALAANRKLTASASPAIRAGAWLRLARTLRKAGKRDEAIQAYRQLRVIQEAGARGVPAPLAVQWAICRMLEEGGRADELKTEGNALRVLLDAAGHNLSRDIYETYAEDAA